ncbi:MAG: low molecular weight phosphotyrosine protein phosphatase [Rhodobacteraceae bacterium]|nr:low molecular weight phosphotyrosine protein phosphatase [Paracoccaceae bacterium]
MVSKVLVVCVGNICRSPMGERLLAARAPGVGVGSAGIAALAGEPADSTAAEVAARHGLSLDGHVARQFTPEMGEAHDLILVMEPGHRREIVARAPHLAGRCLLFDHWTGAAAIPDPYRQDAAVFEAVFARIDRAATAWAGKLAPRRGPGA